MAELNLSDLKQIINQQLKSRQQLHEHLSKATALMHVSRLKKTLKTRLAAQMTS